MKVYVLDEDRSGARRSWVQMIPGIVELSWDNGRRTVAPEIPVAGSVVVCHRLSDGAFARIVQLADGGVVTIVVSGSHGTGTEGPTNLYRRHAPVGLGCDNRFSGLFARFRSALENDELLDWKLIEYPPPPDALFAYHLLSLLPSADVATGAALQAICKEAIDEAETIAGATGATELGNIHDAERRREFLRKCS
jgi:hypothetical protein